MMDTSPTNKQAHVRFGGAEDNSIRSAWRTTNRSVLPPCQVERKATLGLEGLEKAMADAALVAALDAESDYETQTNDKVVKALGIAKPPSSLKGRSKTVPILKTSTHSKTHDNDESNKTIIPLEGHRSAWDNNETRHSFTSIMGPTPARRQQTLDETELRDLCASAAAAASDSSSSFSRDGSTYLESSVRSYRGSTPRRSSIEETPGEHRSGDVRC